MGIRKIIFETERYYHVFNRGTDKRIIFHDKEDVEYFLSRLDDFNNNHPVGGVKIQNIQKRCNVRSKASDKKASDKKNGQLVRIIAYCLLPNHFHLLLKQSSEDGVTKFMQRVGTSYAKYYNKKYARNGSLFQGKFKAKELKGAGSLEMLSVYVNLNYKHHRIDPSKVNVVSSLDEYVNLKIIKDNNLCDKKEVINVIGGNTNNKKKAYIKYSKMQSRYFIKNKGKEVSSVKFEGFEA